MLTDAQRASYDEWGYCMVPEAFERASAEAMVASVWRELDPKIGTGLDALRQVREANERLRRSGVFRRVGSRRLHAAIDDLLGPDAWKNGRGWGGLLLTPPSKQPFEWDVPWTGWHLDGPCSPVPNILRMFAYLSDVRPRGGGTLVVAGSHRVAAEWAARYLDRPWRAADYRKSLRRSEPWFADLVAAQASPGTRTARFMDESGDLLGIRVRVVELTASAGDVCSGIHRSFTL